MTSVLNISACRIGRSNVPRMALTATADDLTRKAERLSDRRSPLYREL